MYKGRIVVEGVTLEMLPHLYFVRVIKIPASLGVIFISVQLFISSACICMCLLH